MLYCLEAAPVTIRLKNGVKLDWLMYVGLVIMTLGVILEASADFQKSVAKKKDPKRFVCTGLFRLVRCPNYLGEILVWTGVLISGILAMRTPFDWCASLLGYVLIIFVMFSCARRLELRQDKNYGDDPEYQKYVKTVPILLPFVPFIL